MQCVKEFKMPTTPTPPIELGGADQHLEGTGSRSEIGRRVALIDLSSHPSRRKRTRCR